MRTQKKIKLRDRATPFLKKRLNYLVSKKKLGVVTNEMKHIKYHLRKRGEL